MPLIQIIVILVVIGVLLWAVNSFVPMDSNVKQILNAVVVIALVIWLLFWVLAIFGVSGTARVPMP